MADHVGQLSQWAQVLDDADEETARLILQLQLDDFASAADEIGAQATGDLQAGEFARLFSAYRIS